MKHSFLIICFVLISVFYMENIFATDYENLQNSLITSGTNDYDATDYCNGDSQCQAQVNNPDEKDFYTDSTDTGDVISKDAELKQEGEEAYKDMEIINSLNATEAITYNDYSLTSTESLNTKAYLDGIIDYNYSNCKVVGTSYEYSSVETVCYEPTTENFTCTASYIQTGTQSTTITTDWMNITDSYIHLPIDVAYIISIDFISTSKGTRSYSFERGSTNGLALVGTNYAVVVKGKSASFYQDKNKTELSKTLYLNKNVSDGKNIKLETALSGESGFADFNSFYTAKNYFTKTCSYIYIDGAGRTRCPDENVMISTSDVLSDSLKARVTYIYYAPKMGWTNSCNSYELSANNCSMIGSSCTSGAETRNVSGYPVYSSCWKYSQTYYCNVENTCNNLPTRN